MRRLNLGDLNKEPTCGRRADGHPNLRREAPRHQAPAAAVSAPGEKRDHHRARPPPAIGRTQGPDADPAHRHELTSPPRPQDARMLTCPPSSLRRPSAGFPCQGPPAGGSCDPGRNRLARRQSLLEPSWRRPLPSATTLRDRAQSRPSMSAVVIAEQSCQCTSTRLSSARAGARRRRAKHSSISRAHARREISTVHAGDSVLVRLPPWAQMISACARGQI